MSNFERPSYISETGKLDKNALRSLIDSTQATVDALERQISSAPQASIPSIEVQIRVNKEKLNKLREEFDILETGNIDHNN